MSGSSLDGVDIAYCIFEQMGKRWHFRIKHAQTIPYSRSWLAKLQKAPTLTGEELMLLDVAYGAFLGSLVTRFIRRFKIRRIDFLASHGHTIFHQPRKHLTFQLGNGAALHASSGLRVVNNFRSEDVALGGEGAPLVPVGDRMLFGAYHYCLNLGGIANISFEEKGKRIAFDVCFANMALNFLAQGVGKKFDRNGLIAAKGKIDGNFLKALEVAQNTFRKTHPSLGNELFRERFRPLLETPGLPANQLRTYVEFLAKEIALTLSASSSRSKLLCTGGGAFNGFLMDRLRHVCGSQVVIEVPDADIVKYKEALVFAFLGVLRARGEVNCLKSVTNASRDSSAGDLIGF